MNTGLRRRPRKAIRRIVLPGLLCLNACMRPEQDADQAIRIPRLPRLFPDYTDLVIPPNSAPINFRIQEDGQAYRITIRSGKGEPVVLRSTDPRIRIPEGPWRRLLARSKGDSLTVQVEARTEENRWMRFEPVVHRVAASPVDGFLVYRKLRPYHTLWGGMGLYQRDLSTFSEVPVLLNRTTDDACINCHSFYQKKPDRMILHVRGRIGSGMLAASDDSVIKVDTRTAFNQGHATFRSWHPDGEQIAVSVNRFIQLFHATGESREVCDLGSDLMLYHFATRTMSTFPAIARPDRMETYPCWAPDGRRLYFSSAPAIESYLTEKDDRIDAIYKKIRYDLQAIDHDPDAGTWGPLVTLVSSEETGKSLLQPTVSPDGRWLIFCMAGYGGFPIFNRTSDLCIMDLETGAYRKPAVNSNDVESSPCWSSNGRWLVFVSKRMDGMYAFPYLCHVDADGRLSKPFPVPQKNPDAYALIRETFNVPEFVTGPIKTSWEALSEAAVNPAFAVRAKLDEKVRVDHVTGASVNAMWRQP